MVHSRYFQHNRGIRASDLGRPDNDNVGARQSCYCKIISALTSVFVRHGERIIAGLLDTERLVLSGKGKPVVGGKRPSGCDQFNRFARANGCLPLDNRFGKRKGFNRDAGRFCAVRLRRSNAAYDRTSDIIRPRRTDRCTGSLGAV